MGAHDDRRHGDRRRAGRAVSRTCGSTTSTSTSTVACCDRELRLSRCADCGWWHHRPKPICPRCWSTNVRGHRRWPGRGTIHLADLPAPGSARRRRRLQRRRTPSSPSSSRSRRACASRAPSWTPTNDDIAIGRRVRARLDRARRPAVPRVGAWRTRRGLMRSRPEPRQGPGRVRRGGHHGLHARRAARSPRRRSPLEACVAGDRGARASTRPRSTVSSARRTAYVQSALGIPDVNYYVGAGIPFGFAIANAVGAIASGQADVVLAYHSIYRNPSNSRVGGQRPVPSAAMDRRRRRRRRVRARQRERRRRLHRVGEPLPPRVPARRGTCSATSRSTTARTRRATRRRSCATRSRWTTTSRRA